MCCFSFDERELRGMQLGVKATDIFARGLPDGRQYLVYSMLYSSPVELAMILPLPTPPGPAEDAVGFIDLSGFAEFFIHLDGGFPDYPDDETQTLSASEDALEVHSVGSYEASFVPSQKDFARLDARFRMPKGALERLPQYRDYGFAVFKLKAGEAKVHPMAFSFPRRRADELFFPTVHVHDGTVPAQASFDHRLYCQDARPDPELWRVSNTWARSEEEALAEVKAKGVWRAVPAPAGAFIDCARAKGIVAPQSTVARRVMSGRFPNADTLVPAAP